MANVNFVGSNVAVGPGAATPVPVRLIARGLPVALSVMVSTPLRAPNAVGLNVTSIVQFEPAATAPPLVQVPPDLAKLPVAAMVVMLRDALPVLLSVTVCAALAVLST